MNSNEGWGAGPWQPPAAIGPMSQVPATNWPAGNVPAHPAEQQPTFNIPVETLNELRDKGLTQDRDGLLLLWQQSKDAITAATAREMELRKLCVKALVAQPKEGVNNVDLGNGYTAKATVKFNYNLKSPVETVSTVDAVDNVIDQFRRLDNEGAFIADRLFKWTVDISLTEYRLLCEQAKTSATKAAILRELNTVLEIKDAAPTLAIVEPKAKKGGR